MSDYLNEQMPHWLRLSGEYRIRGEAVEGVGLKPNNNDSYALGRTRLNMTLIPTSWLKLQFQGQDAELFGRNPVKADAAPYEDAFNIRQAYVEIGNVEAIQLVPRTPGSVKDKNRNVEVDMRIDRRAE